VKILFCGTPAFALPSLEKLFKSGHPVVGVVTQPDRPRGRCRTPQPSPVKELALSHSLPVFQPQRLSDPVFLSSIQRMGAECAAVVAYGRLLPKEFLTLFRHGAINLHASLLPKYRGAAPIQWAVLRGETETGVTVFELDEQLDHGPILLQTRIPILPEENAASLAGRMAQTGGMTLVEALDLLETGMTSPVPQEDSQATQAPMLTKEEGIIRWELPAEEIRNRVRGLQPWPGATTGLGDKPLKLLAVIADPARAGSASPGTVLSSDPTVGLWIQTGRGQLRIDRLQPAGGNPMSAAEFLRGHPIRLGDKLRSQQA